MEIKKFWWTYKKNEEIQIPKTNEVSKLVSMLTETKRIFDTSKMKDHELDNFLEDLEGRGFKSYVDVETYKNKFVFTIYRLTEKI